MYNEQPSFEIPARDRIIVNKTDVWVSIIQDGDLVGEQKIKIHVDDLPKIIDYLRDIIE
jgi:signal peptidase I